MPEFSHKLKKQFQKHYSERYYLSNQVFHMQSAVSLLFSLRLLFSKVSQIGEISI